MILEIAIESYLLYLSMLATVGLIAKLWQLFKEKKIFSG